MTPEAIARIAPDLASRIVADSRDRVGWMRARSRGITATDVAQLTSHTAIARAADAKLGGGSGFSGNAYTDHGRRREPEIAAWVAATHGIHPSSALFHAVVEKRHLATPDGITVDADGRVTLAEIKTTNKTWRSIPRTYLRQVWWQQHVLGAERTLVVWEEHDGFVPVGDEPRCAWVDRDEREIAQLVRLATELIDELYRRTTLRRTGQAAQAQPGEGMPQTRPTMRPREPYRALALSD
ncbi:YqaJ viral recombinase family protein [Microbacterium sp. bgisy203]|uniref:YqaJ viral recombinase family protein n=1 Tax=Microbacterium sp. bgisy203 TaxID=3413799 RepID=UPI003D72F814